MGTTLHWEYKTAVVGLTENAQRVLLEAGVR